MRPMFSYVGKVVLLEGSAILLNRDAVLADSECNIL